jgi:hypothetical protein
MGLKDLFTRWTKGEDRRAVERAEAGSRLTGYERAVESEDFEGRKDDLAARSTFPGSGAEAAAGDDLPG